MTQHSRPCLLAGTVLLVLLIAGPLLAQAPAAAELRQAIQQWNQWTEAPASQHPDREEAGEAAFLILELAQAEIAADRPDRALEALAVLSSDSSAALIESVNPPGLPTFRDRLRRITGDAFLRRSEQVAVRGDRRGSERDARAALQYYEPGENGHARSWIRLAVLFNDQGMDAMRAGRQPDAVAFLSSAAASYMQVLENPPEDAGLVFLAERNIERLAGLGLPLQVPGMPDPEPELELPEAEPNFIERLIGEEIWSDIVAFGEGLTSDRSLHFTLLRWAVIAAAFILLYWIVPRWLLRLAGRRGSITAGQWLPLTRFLGIFALLGWLFGALVEIVRIRRHRVPKPKENSCASCGASLEDPKAYEDLVFSKCPSCGGTVKPIHTIEGYIKSLADSLASDAERLGEDTRALEQHLRTDAVQRLTTALITLAVRRRASDLHVEPLEDCLLIRQRIDGIMTEMFRLPRSLGLVIVSSLKVKANINIAEKRIPQDGKFQVRIDSTDIDVRAASSPVGLGEKISLRLLDIRSIRLDVGQLGMSPEGQEVFRRAISEPHGLILVTGPTGSGKTTTIYVALQAISSGEKNIISIEDPIEFRIPGVNQIQVNPAAGLSFASGLRSILRQDPDIIVVGETRDRETAEISVNAATTGHLVFTTLHTIDSASSVARLIDLGVGPRQFADALTLVAAQRLIRLVCTHCSEGYDPPDGIVKDLRLSDEEVRDGNFRRGRGCKVCNKTGYHRRTGIFELLKPSERLLDAIENQSLTTADIRELAIKGGMRTLRQEALRFLLEGRTTAEETIRVTR